MKKAILGLVETVQLKGVKTKRIKARIDTGATRCSIDKKLVDQLGINPTVKKKRVRSAQGTNLRPVVVCHITLKHVKAMVECTVADRSHMRYPVLIGQNMLKKNGFIIDPDK